MKYFVCLIVLFSVAIALNGQNAENGLWNYKLDSVQEFKFSFEDTSFQLANSFYVEYNDDLSYQTETVTFFSGGSKSKTIKKFNSVENLDYKSTLFKSEDSSIWQTRDFSIYKYDEFNKLAFDTICEYTGYYSNIYIDTVYYYNFYDYDVDGNLIEKKTYLTVYPGNKNYDQNIVNSLDKTVVYEYDEMGNLLVEEVISFLEDNTQRTLDKIEYTYENNNSRYTTKLVYRYSSYTDTLEKISLDFWYTDELNRVILSGYQRDWDHTNDTWENGLKKEYQYFQESDEIIYRIAHNFNEGAWVPQEEYIATLTNDGKIVSSVMRFYIPALNEWRLLFEQKDFEYGDGTLCYRHISYRQDSINAIKLESKYFLDTLDNSNRIENINTYLVENDTLSFVSNSYQEWDAFEARIKNILSFNPELVTPPYNALTPLDHQYELFIDTTTNIQFVRRPKDLEFAETFTNFKLDSIYDLRYIINYITESGQQLYFYDSKKIKYYYSEYDGPQLSTPITTIPEISLYPNPTSDFITMDSKAAITSSITLHLYNMNGKLVYNEKITSNQKIEVDHLPPGTYIYNVFLKDEIKSGKVIIQL